MQYATLRFTPEAAQWVRHEQWHPQQQVAVHGDGSLSMKLPYADATELSMDILRHGSQVVVESPKALAEQVRATLLQAARRYEGSA